MLHLDYRDVRPIYAQIADGIRGQITAGILQPGDKLPSVREQAMALSINPNTIQRSYRQLEAEGVIATVPGKGCFVQGVPVDTKQQQELLEEFDRLAALLGAMGVSPEALAQRLTQGGK